MDINDELRLRSAKLHAGAVRLGTVTDLDPIRAEALRYDWPELAEAIDHVTAIVTHPLTP